MKNNFEIIVLSILATLFMYSCSEDNTFEGGDNYISFFQLKQGEVVVKATISKDDKIVVNVPENFSLDGSTVNFKLSELAQINPNPATIKDWNADQVFEVSAHNGSKRNYSYHVERSGIVKNGDILLLTQDDVDAFTESKISFVNGSLTIGEVKGENSISNLKGLSSVTQIQNSLSILATYKGADLSGLENLESVGSFIVNGNQNLKTIELPKLKTAITGFSINDSGVEKINFPKLTSVDKAFQIQNSDKIKELSFPALKQVVEDMTIQGPYSANELSSIDLPSLEKVGGNLNISQWKELKSINLPVLKSVIGLAINSMSKIEILSAPKLEALHGGMNISSCDVLKTINFELLKSIPGGINVQNIGLEDFDGFKSLETVGKELFFYNMPQLKSSKGLKNLKTVDGRLYIYNWPLLKDDLEGLSSLSKVEGEITLYQIPFKKFSGLGLSKIQKLAIYGDNVTTIQEIDVRKIDIETLELRNISGSVTLKGDDICNYSVSWDNSVFAAVEGFNEIKSFNYSMRTTAAAKGEVNVRKVYDQLNISTFGLDKVSFPKLTEVTDYFYVSSGPRAFEAPLLKRVGKAKVDAAAMYKFILPALELVDGDFIIESGTYQNPDKLSEINLPKLTTVNGLLDVSGFSDYYGNSVLTNLDGFSALKSVKVIKVINNFKLNDFSGLKNVITSIKANEWKVSNNQYNPTYQNMVDGKYTN